MQEYNICYSLDSNYAEQLAVSITSILKNADNDDNINIYILDGGLNKDDKNKIELLKNIKLFNIEYLSVNEKEFKDCPLLAKQGEQHKDYHVTLPTYFRFKIAELLPKHSKVLYLDCDVIIRTSLKELFETYLDGYSVAMVLDSESIKESKRLNIKKYYNAGVMLINLDYWRKNNVEQQLFNCAKNNQDIILWQDQDIINLSLNQSIKEIDKLWNYQYFQYENVVAEDLANVSILHLAGRFKPWLMPFESNIYDEYYYYLLFTSWKNNVLTYKQNSFGKHLKNQIGGCDTNIRLNATDEDIQKCFTGLEENYNYVKGQFIVAEQKTDEKISDVYNEITKSYEFVKERLNVEEQKNNEKISNIYDEIAKNYEFTKTQLKDVNHLSEQATDKKIDLVYNEITKNYKYTEELTSDLNREIKTRLNLVDDKVSQAKDEIVKNNEYAKEQLNIVEQRTDEKISNVYEEITKNYEYTNNIRDNINASILNLKENIDKNNNYTEYLVESSCEKQAQKLEEAISSVENEIAQREDKIYSAIDNTYVATDEKLKKLENAFSQNVAELSSKINQDITHRFRENYMYSNDNFSKLYKGLKENALNLENILNDKISNLRENEETLKQQISSLKDELESYSNLETVVANLKTELAKQNIDNSSNLELLKKEYEEKLNNQRIKYEKKLMHLENVIEESKKNPIVKFIDKIKKR